MSNFYPPRLNPWLVRGLQRMAPLLCAWRHRMWLQIQPADLQVLRQLRGERVLLLPNHPTFQDWLAIFLLSGRLGQSFYYLAAYERFQGLEGPLIQRLGAYSIRRGLGDRPSVIQTLHLLMRPATHLVIFPEGGCSFQNDTVMPFRTGPVQIALQAMNRLVKRGEPLPNLYAVPISLKYRYTGDMDPVIASTLGRLEHALHVSHGADLSAYQRLRRVAERVLAMLEQRYEVQARAHEAEQWNIRISRIKAHVLECCEAALEIVAVADKPLRERVYAIQNELEERADDFAERDFWSYEAMHQAADGLLNFVAIYDGYVAAAPTPERFLDTLTRLEREVFGINQPRPKGQRDVMVQIGSPINLKDWFEAYQSDRPGTVTQLSQQLQQTVQHQLNQRL